MPLVLTPEVPVHDYTEGRQSDTHSRALPGGGYVTVWSGSGVEDRGYGVYLQRYDEAGVRIGGPILVNTTTVYSQRNPQVAVLESGGFAVVWDDTIPGVAGSRGLFTQTFDASGARTGGETQVGPGGSTHQIAAMPDGGFVVTWTQSSEYPFTDVSARLYDASGQPRGPAWIMDRDQFAGQSNVATADAGFIAVWRATNAGVTTIAVQTYDNFGARVGETLHLTQPVGLTTTEIVRLTDGKFVLVWGQADGLHGQILTASGQVFGEPFLVQQNTTGSSLSHSVVATPDGGFTVAWDQFASGRGVIAFASFFEDGTRNGITVTVGSGQTPGEPPGLVVLANGDVVVTYARYVGDSINFYDVFQTRLKAVPNILEGSASGDVLTGSRASDRLLGHDGKDFLMGMDGNDILIGGNGNDRLDGGAGWDEAVFSGAASDYKIMMTPEGEYVVSGLDGYDTLSGIEILRFDDRTIDLTRIVCYPQPASAAGPMESTPAAFALADAASPTVPIVDLGLAASLHLIAPPDWVW